MPIPQSLLRISTKARKIILCNKHYRPRVQDSQNPCYPCADTLENPATIYKSKERERGIRRINHNIWRPLKLKTQEVSGKVSKAAVVLLMGLLGMVYQAKKLLPPETSGAAEHSPVTSSRIRLKDGRYLPYTEREASPRKKLNARSLLCTALEAPKR